MFEQLPPTSCGTADHDSECLCDVVVDEPAEIMKNWSQHSFMVKRLVEELGIGQPWTPDDLLRLLDFQTMLHDDVEAYNERVAQGSTPTMWENRRKFSPGQVKHIEQMYEDGWTGKQIRIYCRMMWGIETDRTHVSNIRRRAEARRNKNES